jgi:hypothetical protein
MSAYDARRVLIDALDAARSERRYDALLELDSEAFEVGCDGTYWTERWDSDRLHAAIEEAGR